MSDYNINSVIGTNENSYGKTTFGIMTIIMVFAFLYPIVPDCFVIGLNGSSLLYIMVLAGFFLFRRNYLVNYHKSLFWCMLYSLVMVAVQLLQGSVMGAFWAIISLPVMTMVFVDVIKKRSVFLKVIDTIIFAGGLVCILGIFEQITGINVAYTFFNTVGASPNYNSIRLGLIRIIGFTSHAIAYCVYIMFLLSIIIYRFNNLGPGKKKTLFKIIYIIGWVNAIFTVSRSSILMLIICQLLLQLRTGVKKSLKLAFLALLVLTCVLFVNTVFFPKSDIQFLSSFISMFLGIVNPNYANKIANTIGDNMDGFGQRLVLYNWVWDSVKDSLFIGKGGLADFDYRYTLTSGFYTTEHVKKSIEVQYLYQLYHFGIIAMVTQIAMYVKLVVMGLKGAKKRPSEWEGKLSFNFVVGITFFVYFIQFFAVNQATDRYMFNILLYLLFAYNINKIYLSD